MSAQRDKVKEALLGPFVSDELILAEFTERRHESSYFKRIIRRIDDGRPPFGLPGHLRSVERCVARFGTTSYELISGDLDFAIKVIAELPPHRVPTSSEQLESLLTYFLPLRELRLEALQAATREYALNSTSLRRYSPEALVDVDDFLRSVQYTLRDVSSYRKEPNLWGLLGSPTLRRLVDASDRWHRTERGLLGMLRTAIDELPADSNLQAGTDWPPLFIGNKEIDGHEISCLASRRALLAEGLAMRHCVATHAPNCLAGEEHFLSVRRNGERIATMSIGKRCDARRTQWHLLDCRGPSNVRPDSGTTDAATRLIEDLNSGHLEINPAIDAQRYVPFESQVGDQLRIVDVAYSHGDEKALDDFERALACGLKQTAASALFAAQYRHRKSVRLS